MQTSTTFKSNSKLFEFKATSTPYFIYINIFSISQNQRTLIAFSTFQAHQPPHHHKSHPPTLPFPYPTPLPNSQMLSPLVSQRILYASAGLSAFAVFKHTQLAFTELFPRLDRGTGIERLALFAVKSNFLQVGAAWAFIGKAPIVISFLR